MQKYIDFHTCPPVPLVVAHRGARGHAPENTLTAAALGYAVQADLWELDANYTKDGKLVVMHDDTLVRTTDVETAFPGRPSYRVCDFTLDEIKSLDAGSWYAGRAPADVPGTGPGEDTTGRFPSANAGEHMRSFRLMALLAMCLMLLAAPVQAKTTITFWHGMGGELCEITDEMIKEFNASQDKYEVKGVYKGNYDEAMTAAIAAFRAKQHPNLIQIFEVGTASMMAAKGAIRPVYEIMEAASTPVDTSKLLGSVASYYSSTDGKLIAMPFNASTTVLYYNKDAVKKAGGDPDHFPTTWPEVAELAKKIKESGACKYGLTSGWQSWVQLESFSAWHNVPFATNNNGYDGLDTKLLFNSPLHVKHIDFLSKLQKDGVMVYVGRKSEAINAFTSGEAGILMNSSGSYAAVKAGAKFQWGVALLPYWPDVKGAPQNTVIGGAAIWAMAGHSKDAEKGAAAFLNYLLKPEVQARFHQLTGYVPVTLEGYELTKQQGFYDKNPGTDIAVKALSDKKPTINSLGLRLGNFVQIRNIIDEELEAVWAGKKTAKQALDAAVERGNAELARFAKANKK